MLYDENDIDFSKMDREYLKDMVEEALSYAPWGISDGSSIKYHEHCLICWRTLTPDGGVIIYESEGGYLDEKCFKLFIEKYNRPKKDE